MEIEFLNHASVRITTPDATILTDPWFSGSAFNDGWDLIYRDEGLSAAAMHGTTHIYISHEHPDHFSPAWLSGVPAEIREAMTVLFQVTKDKRVVNFLRSKGFKVVEMEDQKEIRIGTETRLAIESWDFYDSFLHVADSHASMLNLNDCGVADTKDLMRIRDRYGSPTVLLTQFSYAAWKGGKANKEFRVRAAEERLDAVAAQATTLGADYLIPTASFIYLSHEENQYLNDSANSVSDVLDRSSDFPSQVVVMKPYDRWKVGESHDNDQAVRFWNERFDEVTNLPMRRSEKSYSLEELEQTFRDYQQRIYGKNGRFLIWLARFNPVVRGFLPITMRLTDLDLTVDIDLRRGMTVVDAGEIDVEMHSSSLIVDRQR